MLITVSPNHQFVVTRQHQNVFGHFLNGIPTWIFTKPASWEWSQIKSQPSCTSQWGQWVPSTLAAFNFAQRSSRKAGKWHFFCACKGHFWIGPVTCIRKLGMIHAYSSCRLWHVILHVLLQVEKRTAVLEPSPNWSNGLHASTAPTRAQTWRGVSPWVSKYWESCSKQKVHYVYVNVYVYVYKMYTFYMYITYMYI